MNAPFPTSEQAMLAHTRPRAFDALFRVGKLAPGNAAANARRWAAGEALRRLHASGWQDPCGGSANPLESPAAAVARGRFAEIEAAIPTTSWPVVVRVVLTGDAIHECRDLLTWSGATGGYADAVLLDRLTTALDRMAPMLSGIAA